MNRQKKNCSSLACSNQALAFSECKCRLHSRANHTFESRKFNVFIDLFVGEIHLWTVRDDQRELHPFRAWSLALQQNTPDSRKNQFTYGAPACSSLFFQLPVQWRWDVDRGANRVLLHERLLSHMCHKYGRLGTLCSKQNYLGSDRDHRLPLPTDHSRRSMDRMPICRRLSGNAL